MKVGVAIQGPLESVGRSGSSAHVPLGNVTESDVIEFNAIQTIAHNYERLSPHFEVVCVTWDSEKSANLELLRAVLPDKDIVLAHDNTRILPPQGHVIPGNNKYRQALSSLIGFQHLANRGCDVVVKVRTDQAFNVRSLIEILKSDLANPEIRLLVPWFNPAAPLQVGDFFFGGRSKDLIGAITYYLNTPENFDLVHEDLFVAFGNFFREHRAVSFKFPPPFLRLYLLRRWTINTWNMISIAEEDTYRDFVWRGESFFPSDKIFRESLAEGITPTKSDFSPEGFLKASQAVARSVRKIAGLIGVPRSK